MSTITKDSAIKAALSGIQSWQYIITSYCREFDKKDEDIKKLLMFLLIDGPLMVEYYNIALDYFLEKFNITLVHDNTGRLVYAY